MENAGNINDALHRLNKSLAPVAFLAGNSVTLADFAVWGALKGLLISESLNKYKWMNEQTSEWIDGWTDRQMN